MSQPSFLERIMSYDGTGLPGGVERAKGRVGEPGYVTRNIGDRALEALAVVKAERKLIATIRQALKEYDRYVKPDRRVNNGGKRVDAKALAKGVKLIRSGMSIRRASAVTGISYSTLWVAKGRS